MKKHKVGDLRHKLSNVDINNRTCMCSVCGETTIYIKNGRPRCATKNMFDQMGLDYYIGMKQIEAKIGKRPDSCPVCGRKDNIRIVVDHNHSTGEIRGWLCDKCNIALGYLAENPQTITNLCKYITKVNKK